MLDSLCGPVLFPLSSNFLLWRWIKKRKRDEGGLVWIFFFFDRDQVMLVENK